MLGILLFTPLFILLAMILFPKLFQGTIRVEIETKPFRFKVTSIKETKPFMFKITTTKD